VEVEAGVEVAITTTTILSMRQPLRVQCNMGIIHRHHIAMGAVVALMITHTALPRTLLGHPRNINTGRGTDRAAPERTHRRPPRTAEAPLTRMAVEETHRDRRLAIIIGADITLGLRAEVDTVEAAAADTIAGPVAGVDMIMETAAEDSEIVCPIRATTIPTPTMAAIALAAVARCEDVVGVEVTEC